MPNFKCKSIKDLHLPFEKEGICFHWVAQNDATRLIYTSFKEANFFVQITSLEDELIVKGEKHSKPEQIGYLQKALLVFKEHFCTNIITEALALKSTRLLCESTVIHKDIHSLNEKLKGFDEIYMEIGFGSGRHLLYQAKTNPQILIIGVEIYTPAIEQVAKLAMKEKLNNVLLVKSDARLLLSELTSNLLSKIFLHFPVPWDKQAHRRVMSVDFVKECLRVLKVRGQFELRTDSKEYFELSKDLFLAQNAQIQAVKNADLKITSKYEARWKKQHKNIYDLIAICEHLSPALSEESSFTITNLHYNIQKIAQMKAKFAKAHFKGEDFFIRLENLYTIDEANLLLKLVFGAFCKNEHGYLLLNENSHFLFKEPFYTKENVKALKKLDEFLRLN